MIAAAEKSLRLPQIEIASPCSAEWSAMKGDNRVRFCGECQKHVFNLSALPEDEAAALIEQHAGSLCVRLFRRPDGTVLTADCPRGLAVVRRRLARGWAGLLVLAASLLISSLTALGMTRAARRVNGAGALNQLRNVLQPVPPPIMGKICQPAPPATGS